MFEPKTEKENRDVIAFVKTTIWLGVNDIDEEGQFKYRSDNSTLVFENWNSYEPNDIYDNEDCAVVSEGHDGIDTEKWNDIPCDEVLPFVCEKDGM